MLKRLASLVLLIMIAAFCAGCDTNKISGSDIDDPVTVTTVNTSGDRAVRGFLESIFNNNRELFNKCFPEKVISDTTAQGIDMFEEFRSSMGTEGEFIGTQYMNYNLLSEEGGYSDAGMYRSNISEITGIPEDKIGELHIEQIKVYFNVNGTNKYTEIYAIAYESDGQWYMYELRDNDAGFNK